MSHAQSRARRTGGEQSIQCYMYLLPCITLRIKLFSKALLSICEECPHRCFPVGFASTGPRGGDMDTNLGEVPNLSGPILESFLDQKGGSKNDPFLGPPFGPPRCPSWAPLVKIVGSWGPKWVPKWCQNGSQKRPPQNSETCALA